MKSLEEWIKSGIVYRDGDGTYMMHVWISTNPDVYRLVSLGMIEKLAEHAANVIEPMLEP